MNTKNKFVVKQAGLFNRDLRVVKTGSDLEKIEEVMGTNKMSSLEVATFQEVWTKNSSRRIVQKQKKSGGFCSIV